MSDKVSRTLISGRVILKIELVIFLRIPPLTRRQDLGGKWRLIPLLADFLCNLLCDLMLFISMRKDRTAVLRTNIRTLSVFCCGVVHAVEKFKKLAVGHN